MIYITTNAYNAASTLRRAIESIKSQTLTDFTYFVLDNGSTDNSWEIIQEYAAQDSRIVPLKGTANCSGAMNPQDFPELAPMYSGQDGYMAVLDAGDEYKPDFLEKMALFCTNNDLDIAFCGSECVSPDGSLRLDDPPNNRVMESGDIVRYISEYYQYTTQFCGIFFRLKLLSRIKIPRALGNFYGMWENKAVLHALEHSKRAGVLAESLRKHYLLPEQMPVGYKSNWFWWVNEMFGQLRMFLMHNGTLRKESEKFLWLRYFVWIKHIMAYIINSDAPTLEQIVDINDIVKNDRTKLLLRQNWKYLGMQTDKKEFLREYLAWAATLPDDDETRLSIERLKKKLNKLCKM